MLNREKLMAFVATSDGARARRFYETALGFRVLSDDEFALALDTGSGTLRVQKVGLFVPASFTALGWAVSDIAATIDHLGQHGVTFERFSSLTQDARAIWQSPSGARVAWFKDPDGNTLSLTQF
jgi:catechol 2,3-dioxygenase-like lactoylglutathione lyase family enzyme